MNKNYLSYTTRFIAIYKQQFFHEASLYFNKTKFAQYSIFLYLIYDVLQHHQATLKNLILVKKKN